MLPFPAASTMLPSGIATTLCPLRAGQPASAVTRVQVTPLSVERQTSFVPVLLLGPSLWPPPTSRMLPSVMATLLIRLRADHPAPAFTRVQFSPLSTERHVSFSQLPLYPPARTMLPSVATTAACPLRAGQPACAVICVQVVPPSVDRQTSFENVPP